MHYLYRITNLINNRVYIGQSNKEKERWRQHKYFGRNPEKTGQYLHRAMNKYGIENFIYEIIAMSFSQENANETEKVLIKQYNSRDKNFGYNLTPGGEFSWNSIVPKEMRSMYGKKQSLHQRQKISEMNSKRKIKSESWKQKVSFTLKEKYKNDPTLRERISKANSGENHPQAKLSNNIVAEIRREFEEKKIKQKVLAEKYGVSAVTINQIVNYKIYKT